MSARRTAVIVGSEGQDGRLLFSHLESLGERVIGIGRGTARTTGGEAPPRSIDIGSEPDVTELIAKVQPDEVYHLAAVHHSSEEKAEAADLFRQSHSVNFLSLIYLLEAVRRFSPRTRVFYAASSHVYGEPSTEVQNESSPLNPDSVYGLTKASGLLACRTYRNAHQLFAATGILYNHESHLRSPKFLSQKIVRAALEIRAGKQDRLVLGNLGAVIDWGYAPDYVRGMKAILGLDRADEFIIATGIRHTVSDFARIAFEIVGLDWTRYVMEDRSIPLRKSPTRIGDPSKLRHASGWRPEVEFEEMIRKLVEGASHA